MLFGSFQKHFVRMTLLNASLLEPAHHAALEETLGEEIVVRAELGGGFRVIGSGDGSLALPVDEAIGDEVRIVEEDILHIFGKLDIKADLLG